MENNENTNIYKNGEGEFIKFLLKNYSNKFTFFDIGANKGNYSNFIIKNNSANLLIFGHLFEPLESCFSILKRRFNKKDLVLNNFACSDSVGKIVFFSDKSNEHSSLFNWSVGLKETRVNSIRLDGYCINNGINKINLVKIDTEGNDLFVLNGFGKKLNSKNIDFIQFEYGIPNISSKTYLKNFYTILLSKGFVIGKLFPKHIEIRNYSHYMENFHNSNYVAISLDFIKKNDWIKKYIRGETNLC